MGFIMLVEQTIPSYSNSFNALTQLQTELVRLQQAHDLETHIDEKIRLEVLITHKQQALVRAYQQETSRLRCNRSFSAALDLWKTASSFLTEISSNQRIQQEIIELQALEQQALVMAELKQILSRVKELRPFFPELIQTLGQVVGTKAFTLLKEQIEFFLQTSPSDHEGFLLWWQMERETTFTTNKHLDMARLANRIQQGDMVLFMGSGVIEHKNSSQQIVMQLAQHIGYQDFKGSLSSIAEYYQLRPEFGTSALLTELRMQMQLPTRKVNGYLYQALAKITPPVVLISATYDNLLESAFRHSGKPFVELASIVRRSEDYDIGHVLVSFSDHHQAPQVYPEEELSRLRFIEDGYSIIYKIRGSCMADPNKDESILRDALTLTESHYFNFARYAERIIPSYVARQLRNRGFLFVGYQPSDWEERLLAGALLERRQSQESCYVIGASPDPLEDAYWAARNVKSHPISLSEFDRYLAEGLV
jgi:hypothetical protein